MSYAKEKKVVAKVRLRLETPQRKGRGVKIKIYHLTPQGRAAMEQGFADTPKWRARAVGVRLFLLTDYLLISTKNIYQFANQGMIEKAVEEMLKPNGAEKSDYRIEVLR